MVFKDQVGALLGVAALALGLPVFGGEELPSPAPKVAALFPAGVRQGTSAEIEIRGSRLSGLKAIEFVGRGVRAEVIRASESNAAVRVTADADAEAGRRDFRLTTTRGSYVGVFTVGTLPERSEVEPNDDFRKPEALALPATVNGVVGAEDWDHFAFQAEPGRTYAFDVVATRNGSRLDAELAILDPAGHELAWNDDYTIFGDPHLTWTAPGSGRYVIRVGSLAGGANAVYRLVAGTLPHLEETLPAGLGPGQVTTMVLRGRNLAGVDRVWLGDRVLAGAVLKATAEEVIVRFDTPASLVPGTHWLHLAAGPTELPIPLPVRLSVFPEITVTQAPRSRETAVPITGTVVVHGRLNEPKETHFFRFEARAGETYILEPESMKLEYHVDPAIAVLDAEGRKLAFADDPGVDDRADEYQLDADLAVTIERSGTYYVMLRDAMSRGGARMVYRLTVRRTPPDLVVELREPVKSVYPGQDYTVQARVRRRGWTAPVEVWFEDVPEGVRVDKQTASPANTIVKDTCGVDREIDGSIVLLPLRIHGARPGRYHWRLRARGVMNGRTVERDAIVRYENLAAGYTYGAMQQQQADLTIVEAPAR